MKPWQSYKINYSHNDCYFQENISRCVRARSEEEAREKVKHWHKSVKILSVEVPECT